MGSFEGDGKEYYDGNLIFSSLMMFIVKILCNHYLILPLSFFRTALLLLFYLDDLQDVEVIARKWFFDSIPTPFLSSFNCLDSGIHAQVQISAQTLFDCLMSTSISQLQQFAYQTNILFYLLILKTRWFEFLFFQDKSVRDWEIHRIEKH